MKKNLVTQKRIVTHTQFSKKDPEQIQHRTFL